MKTKILLGIALLIVGVILLWDITMTINSPLFIVGAIAAVIGSILLIWGLYQWERKRAVDVIAEGIKKAQEKEKRE